MSKEALAQPTQNFSEKQLTFQRLMRVNSPIKQEEIKGDTQKRMALNLAILAGSTGLDGLEGYLVDKAEHLFVEPQMHKVKQESKKTAEAVLEGVKMVEEWGSDTAIMAGMNHIAQSLTGVDGATYVSPTAEVTSDWLNVFFQVFLRDKTRPWHKKLENWLNPVNTEAYFRLYKELPFGLGNFASKMQNKTDHILEHSPVVININKAAGKFFTGYHIVKNLLP